MNEISIHDMEEDHLRKTAEVLNVSQVFETASKYSQKDYRMHVTATDSAKRVQMKGLIDTGANSDVLSLNTCRKLGILHLIDRNRKKLTLGVNGQSIGAVGTVYTTLLVGDVPYTANFTVLQHISSFDIIFGTRFLSQSKLMDRIYNLVENGVGHRNISKGN